MKFKSILALLLLALAGLGEYYVYDSLTSIDSLVRSSLGFNAAQFGLLYSFYSVANVFFLALFFAGILIDIWGYQKSGFLFVSLCLAGALITAFGGTPAMIPQEFASWLENSFFQGYSASFKLMVFGRMIFGVGAEALLIVIMKALVVWFGENKVALAYGFSLVFYRLGAFLALNLQAKLAVKHSLEFVLWFAAYVMACSALIYLFYLILDRYKPNIKVRQEDKGPFRFSQIKTFPLSFWFITLICILFYGSITSFEIFDPFLLKARFNLTVSQSGFYASVLLLSTMIFMPICGYIIDRNGKRATFLAAGSFVGLIALLWFTFLQLPVIPIIALGASYSLVAVSIWASIPAIIHRKYQGTAFGILFYLQNVGLMLFPWLSGYIADVYTKEVNQKQVVDYYPILGFFILLMFLSLIFSILLKNSDKSLSSEGDVSIEKPSSLES